VNEWRVILGKNALAPVGLAVIGLIFATTAFGVSFRSGSSEPAKINVPDSVPDFSTAWHSSVPPGSFLARK
jgi:hypothetical protein